MAKTRGIQKDSIFVDGEKVKDAIKNSEYGSVMALAEEIGWDRRTIYRSIAKGWFTKRLFDDINTLVDLKDYVVEKPESHPDNFYTPSNERS